MVSIASSDLCIVQARLTGLPLQARLYFGAPLQFHTRTAHLHGDRVVAS